MKFNPQPKKGIPEKKPRKPLKRTPIKRKVIVKKKPSLDDLRAIANKAAAKHRPRKATGELALYREIWEEREHISEVSGQPLIEPTESNMDMWVRQFSHILTKGAYPKFRKRKDNIKLVTGDEHNTWEFKPRSTLGPQWDWVKEKAEQLKREYYAKN